MAKQLKYYLALFMNNLSCLVRDCDVITARKISGPASTRSTASSSPPSPAYTGSVSSSNYECVPKFCLILEVQVQ